ncbi:hypothetical protein AGRA3207_007874 (plasmid) [Actinomadura graeca]|uniref:FtsK domain-containing protein n=1 Tax=Actinomadura graeca TaxID=2750812 RepID=A0ABX8R7M5_9ACTN|nr:hypothetical protein [Actinomadura graeca]QXJ27076.1 hypothetical protein AGRA3207_007874 [Actinomadura graeca]
MSTTKKATTTKAAGPGVDWSMVPHGPLSGAAVTLAAGTVGGMAHVSPVWAAAAAGVGALGAVLESAHRDAGPGALLYRLGCWVGAGGWLTWAWCTGDALTTNGLAAVAAGGVAAAAFAPLGRIRARGGAPARRAGGELVAVTARPAGPLAADWEARFRRVCRVRVQVTRVQHWDNAAGYTLTCELPPGPATMAQIGAATTALATDARLPDGCGVEAPQPGRHRGELTLGVSTRNLLGVRGDEAPPKIPYPADYSPRSLLETIDMGIQRDGSVSGMSLREDSMLVVGPKGGGKTNVLDVTTLGVARCTDALVWHIDLNGGGMSQLWLHAWLEGRCERPPIDWAAPSPREALLMVTVALAIAKDRKGSYRTFKAQSNVKLLPISPELPAIVLMVDEGAEALSPANRDPIGSQVRAGLEELLRIGRNEAVVPHFSALRPTQTTISPDVLHGCAWRLGMYGTSEGDLAHLYGWHKGINAIDLPVKGTTFVGHKPDAPTPVKVWYLEPEQMQEAALAVAAARPELDEASAEIADAQFAVRLGPQGTPDTLLSGIYAGRYERMRAAFTGQPVKLPISPGSPAPAASAPGGPSDGPAPRPAAAVPAMVPAPGQAPTLRGAAADWPDPMAAAAALARPVGGTAADWPDLFPARPASPAQPRPASASGASPRAAVAELDAPQILVAALAAFDAADDDRMHSEALAEALGLPSVWTLAEALRRHGVGTLPNKFVRSGKARRGYSREDIAAAASSAAADGQAQRGG